MSIVPLKKVTLFGIAPESDKIASGLQKELGCVHIQGFQKLDKDATTKAFDAFDRNQHAMKYLHKVEDKTEAVFCKESFDKDTVLAEIEANQKSLIKLNEKRRELECQIEIASHWGEFERPSLEELGGYKLWFYHIPNNLIHKMDDSGYYWEIVSQEAMGNAIVVFSEEEPSHDLIPVHRVDLGDEKLSEVTAELSKINQELSAEEDKSVELTKWEGMLAIEAASMQDGVAVEKVIAESLMEEDVFALQGWVIEENVSNVEAFAEEKGLAFLAEEPTAKDNPPTLLKNNGKVSVGENLVSFYQTPNYREWDPSIVVLFSFAFFFAIIMADAGYGLVIGLLTAWKWKTAGGSDMGKRLRMLGVFLSGACIIYGAIVGSYFGTTPDLEIVKSMKLLDPMNQQGMMMFALLTGMVHIMIANFMAAKAHGFNRLSCLGLLGWVVLIAGTAGVYIGISEDIGMGIELFGLGAYKDLFMIIGAIGLGMILFFTSTRPFNSVKNIIMRLVDGLVGLTGLTKAFGDILSYLRLFALGLSSSMLATIFNDLASKAMSIGPVLGVIVAILVLIFGHTIGMMLGIMGGLIHGLRLALLEFFGWSLKDDGQQFKPFMSRELLLWNKK